MNSNAVLKDIGYDGESIVLEHYLSLGYILLFKNYTIRGGEIDLIFESGNTIVFVEVKVVDGVDDVFDYVSPKKLHTLRHTIDVYCYDKRVKNRDLQLDVVLVKNGKIWEMYQSLDI